MPLIFLGFVLLIVVLLIPLTLPVLIIQRYRMGTVRRRARGWIATINVYGATVSAMIFLTTATITNIWVPRVLAYSALGLLGGFVLGFLGLALSRWETDPLTLHYTPNRWLILVITLVVVARIGFGFWRGWNTWQTTPDTASWLAAAGAAGSMGAGAVVIGYYLIYWIGLKRRLNRHIRAPM